MPHKTHPRLTKNNFDLLRLLFAGSVCLLHAHDLSGFQQLDWIATVLAPTREMQIFFAVKAFFVVSGFLIFMSFERSSSFNSYISKRVLRIYPAYFTIVMLCALGLVAVSSKPLNDYFSVGWFKYVAANLSFLNFLQHTLVGVFETNKLAVVNGSLWTLKIEVVFYLTVPLLVWLFRRFYRFPILALIYCLSVIYAGLMTTLAQRTGSGIYVELARQLPAQLCYFMAGAFFYYYLPLFERHLRYFVVAAIVILAINWFYPLPLFEPFALATLVVFFGLFLYAGNVGKYGDFSYGVYIVHFPVIQLLLNTGWFRDSPWYFLASVICITLMGGIAMWHLVEKRFLRRNSHYLVVTASSSNDARATAGR